MAMAGDITDRAKTKMKMKMAAGQDVQAVEELRPVTVGMMTAAAPTVQK
jgi:hypothetical protein